MDKTILGKIINCRFWTVLVLTTNLILMSESVRASIGGSGLVGPPTAIQTADEHGERVRVNLSAKGDLLVGHLNHEFIEMITVFAPGSNEAHLILRNNRLSDGSRSLLLSAPTGLSEKALRITFYLKQNSKNLAFFNYSGGNWNYLKPQPVRVASENGGSSSHDILLGYSVNGFGFYRMIERDSLPTSFTYTIAENPSNLRWGGDIFTGFRPWFWSIFILIVGWFFSRLMHKIEYRLGK